MVTFDTLGTSARGNHFPSTPAEAQQSLPAQFRSVLESVDSGYALLFDLRGEYGSRPSWILPEPAGVGLLTREQLGRVASATMDSALYRPNPVPSWKWAYYSLHGAGDSVHVWVGLGGNVLVESGGAGYARCIGDSLQVLSRVLFEVFPESEEAMREWERRLKEGE